MLDLPKVNYRERLDRVLALLDGQSMLLLAQPQAMRNSTVEGAWRQDGLFYYLTGFSETDAALLLLSHREVGEARIILFLRDKDPVAELWNGLRLGVSAAKEVLSIDEAFAWEDLWSKLPSLLSGSKGLHFALGASSDNDRRIIESLRKHRSLNARHVSSILPVFDPAHIGGTLRLIKQPSEIARMKAAASVTKKAFVKVLSELSDKQTERDVHATILNEFLRGGAEMEAYGSIVAGGNHACILHYRDNNAPLSAGELLLIDAGCQVDNYASDVTRTFPISGKFSSAQKALYEVCLQSQKDAIEAAKPGKTWVDVQDAAFKTLAQGLIDLGLIKMPLTESIEKNAHKHFCPHSISHWIGLDVHDSGRYMNAGKPIPFEPGMYFSVEPGIYINASDTSVPDAYRGIGIRIEDDVLITASGNEVLTAGIPKEVSEVER